MFSVLVPLYNKQDFIVRTVESVLSQSFSDFELIVVDDGSTDFSVARLGNVSDPRLHMIRQGNAGKGAARNRAIRESSRPWLAFLDADDYWFPNHLQELAGMAERFPDAGLLGTSYGEGEDPSSARPDGFSNARRIDYFREAARNIGVIWSSATALRSSVAAEVGGFGPWRTGEDLEYWARVALVAPVIKSDRVTAYYLRNSESEMAQVHREEAKTPQSRSLFETWPSVAYLERVKADIPNEQRQSIERYQRNAAYLTMMGRLAARDVSGARLIARQLPGMQLDSSALLALLLHLPAPVIEAGLSLRALIRRR